MTVSWTFIAPFSQTWEGIRFETTMKTDSGLPSRLNMSGIADLARRGRCMARALVGRDVYYRPQVLAKKELHGGRRLTGYGSWTICPEGITPKSIVYSVGVGDDISFEVSLIRSFGLSALFAFDPTPTAISWLSGEYVPKEFRLFQYAIADQDGIAKFFPHDNPDFVAHSLIPRKATASQAVEVPLRTLPTVMLELGHDHIDFLKMDIEGAEYAVIENLVREKVDIRQLLVEFHHHDRHTEGMSAGRTREAVKRLNQAGFKIFHVTPRGEEYSFIKT
jgi:FkbM family methyltransferase